jgi:hypothetical protein
LEIEGGKESDAEGVCCFAGLAKTAK